MSLGIFWDHRTPSLVGLTRSLWKKRFRMAFSDPQGCNWRTKTAKRRTFKNMDTHNYDHFPNQRSWFGRLFLYFSGYPFGFDSFSGIQWGLVLKNKKKKHNIAPPRPRPSNFKYTKLLSCRGTGNFNSTPSKVKDPEKDNMPIAWIASSWVHDDQTQKTWRITKCIFCVNIWKYTKSSWWFRPIHLTKIVPQHGHGFFPQGSGWKYKIFTTTT